MASPYDPDLTTDEVRACAPRKAKVKSEMDKHGLHQLEKSPAGDAGKHPQGVAIDVSRKRTLFPLFDLGKYGILVGPMAEACNLVHPDPMRDAGHFELNLPNPNFCP